MCAASVRQVSPEGLLEDAQGQGSKPKKGPLIEVDLWPMLEVKVLLHLARAILHV